MVVYPEGVFYGNVQLTDVEEIVNKHLVVDEVVERLRIF
jgi:(2Fe-2S) ferredoxin